MPNSPEQKGPSRTTQGSFPTAESPWPRIFWIAVFGVAFGYVEAAVVVYLRALYYPGGFQFPLKVLSDTMIRVEVLREMATIVMLAAVGLLAGRERWSKFGAFLVAFGVWDITFYLSLKVLLGWPVSIFDWDILFLLPVPWIGPVIAPVLIALLMVVGGGWLIVLDARGVGSALSWQAMVLGVAGTAILLYSFMADTPATLGGALPRSYSYWMLTLGMACYSGAFVTLRRFRRDSSLIR